MEGMQVFEPNDMTHPQFGQALREAYAAGVHILALGCHVTPQQVEITHQIPIRL
jgi:sugar fermentation stimulation protein A